MNITIHLGPAPEPERVTDTSLMTFGRYKGLPMDEVPDSYLLWLWNKEDGLWCDTSRRMRVLRDYIWTSFDKRDLRPRYVDAKLPPLTASELSDGPSDGVVLRPDDLCEDDEDIPF